MTKEEIHKVLDLALEYYKLEIYGTGKESEPPTEARIDWIYERMKRSIPSNLDEAATKAYPKMSRISEPHGVIPADNKSHYLGDANEENRAAFKAGAEWMAEQGYTTTGRIIDEMAYYDIQFDELLPNNICDPKDKVVVQIRKK